MKKIQDKVVKPMVAIVLILVLTFADILLLSMQLISFAISENNMTNADNVLFTAYFLDEEGNQQTYLEKKMTDEDIRLYMKIQVKNNGYFNGEIHINDSNFKLKAYEANENIKSINDNTIYLNQINAESTVLLELEIEPIKDELYEISFINKTTNIQISGTYVIGNNKEITIDSTKEVQLVLMEPYSNVNADDVVKLESEIVTNKVYNIDGESKRLVQIQVSSALQNNEYPVKTTTITASVFDLAENVLVSKRGTYATNNDNADLEYNWDKENNALEINVSNQEIDGKIQWNKEQNDTILITYVLDGNVSIEGEIGISARVELYDIRNTNFTKSNIIGDLAERDGAISYKTISQEELSKGYLYYGEETKVNTQSIIDIRYKNISNKIIAKEGDSIYLSEKTENEANFAYVLTKVDKNNLENILGESGVLNIKDDSGNLLGIVTKESALQTDGDNIEISYDAQSSIIIEVVDAENEGRLELIHEKILQENTYEKEQMKTFTKIKTIGSMENSENVEVQNVESTINLLEPESYAVISSNTNTLSTLETNENVEFNVVLKEDDIKYDLYKNPSIEIEFPQGVTEVNAKLNPVYIEGFEVKVSNISENVNGNKIIRLELEGEQTVHSNSISEGIILNVNTDIDVDKTLSTRDTEIILRYTNENEGNNVLEQRMPIKLQSKNGLLVYDKIENYNSNGEVLETTEEGILEGILDINAEERIASNKTYLVNNYDEEINNVEIYVHNLEESNLKLETNGQIEVLGKEANISYIEEGYKIEIESIPALSTIIIDSNFSIPENLEYNQIAQIEQNISYNYLGQNIEQSNIIHLKTEEKEEAVFVNDNVTMSSIIDTDTTDEITGNLEVETKTFLGNKELADTDTVYEGQIIQNIITISNKTGSDLSNVKVYANQQNAVIYDLVDVVVTNPMISDEEFIEHKYGEWSTGEITFDTIENLEAGRVVKIEYQATINEVEGNDKVTYADISVEADNIEKIETQTLKNTIEQGKIKISQESYYREEEEYLEGTTFITKLYIKNLEGQDLEDITVTTQLSDNLYIDKSKTYIRYYYNDDETSDLELSKVKLATYDKENNTITFKIKKLEAQDDLLIMIYPDSENKTNADKELASVNTVATVEGQTYQSNIISKYITSVANEMNLQCYVDNGSTDIQNGDTFDFIIVATNESAQDGEISIIDKFSDIFVINKIEKINSGITTDITSQNDDNLLLIIDELIKSGETLKIELSITVDNDSTIDKEISNVVEFSYNDNYEVREIDFKFTGEIEEYPDDIYRISPDTDTEEDGEDDNTGNNGSTNTEDKNNSQTDKSTISGTVWVDENKNGIKETKETRLGNISVILMDSITGQKVSQTTTNSEGNYSFEVEHGAYIVLFKYDTETYNLTEYQSSSAQITNNSDAISKEVELDGETITVGATDIITLDSNPVNNIDIGLIKKAVFDFTLNKYISKVSVQNAQGTTVYNYDKAQLAKAEIKSKYFAGSTVAIEYIIEVTNEGDIEGYINDIVDYIPGGLEFKSELNSDWYVGKDNNLHSINLANQKIASGSTKTLKLVLTKTLAQSDGGTFANTAEIYSCSNDKGISDVDSTPGNKANGEDDISVASVIISVSTGAIRVILSVIIILVVLIIIGLYIIKKKGGKVDWRNLRISS